MGLCSSCCCPEKKKRKGGKRRRRRRTRSRHEHHSEQAYELGGYEQTGSGFEPGVICVTTFNYDPGSTAEVKLVKGERVEILSREKEYLIAPDFRSPDWLFVRQLKKDGIRGYVPMDFLAPEGTIEAEDYYFGLLKRRDAAKLLKMDKYSAGAFLIRDSESQLGNQYYAPGGCDDIATKYVLSVKDDNANLHHYKMYDNGMSHDRYYIAPTMKFNSLKDLIDYYRTHDVPPVEICHKLTMPIERPPPVRKSLSKEMVDRWREIPRSQIELNEKVGAGNFGEVYRAIWRVAGGSSVEVAVKQLKDVTDKAKEDMFNEASAMRNLFHKNIVRLYGVISTGEPYCMVTEYMRNGSLKSYLQERRVVLRLPPLPEVELIDISAQICRGMAYLEHREIVHRDLAARNVLINIIQASPLKIESKISDFGLSRFLHNKDVYKMARDVPMPRRWMAPEAIVYNEYTTKSDVWSFGCTCIELFSEGDDPWTHEDPDAVLKHLKRGERPPPPDGMRRSGIDQLVYYRCTKRRKDDRPTFAELLDIFEKLLPSGDFV